MIEVILKLSLKLAATSLWPAYDMTPCIEAAIRAETTEVPAALLVAISYHESRCTPTAVSEVKRINGSTALFCGPHQVVAKNRSDCHRFEDYDLSAAKAVEEIGVWRAMCRNLGHDTLECALAGYAEGMAGARRGSNSNARMKLVTTQKLLWKRRFQVNRVRARLPHASGN